VTGPAPLAQDRRYLDLEAMTLKTARTNWRDVVLVCRKCQRKLDGEGFGPDGDKPLKKALRKALKAGKGRKAQVLVMETDCFDVCPKNAVVAVRAGRRASPMLIVPTGADLTEVRAALDLESDRPETPLRVVGQG
jgi:predicted metal-binding protein